MVYTFNSLVLRSSSIATVLSTWFVYFFAQTFHVNLLVTFLVWKDKKTQGYFERARHATIFFYRCDKYLRGVNERKNEKDHISYAPHTWQ